MVVGEVCVEELANRAGISRRTGCFCNPGAGEAAHGLGVDDMARWFGRHEPVWPVDVHEGTRREHGREFAAIRVSVSFRATTPKN